MPVRLERFELLAMVQIPVEFLLTKQHIANSLVYTPARFTTETPAEAIISDAINYF